MNDEYRKLISEQAASARVVRHGQVPRLALLMDREVAQPHHPVRVPKIGFWSKRAREEARDFMDLHAEYSQEPPEVHNIDVERPK